MQIKNILSLCFIISCLAILPVNGKYYSRTKRAPKHIEKVTKLHFYLHDTLSGKNPSAVMVAKASVNASTLAFGNVFAIDDKMTVGPNLTSEVIGNARGIYVSTSQNPDDFTINMYVDFGFTAGKFNGSSISVFSRNPVSSGDRELAVVGGRGKFKLARGFVKIKTFTIDYKTGDAILDYTVTVYHY